MDQIIEALGNIGFDWRVALANFVNFLIIFLILKRFVFKPLQERVDERNAVIAKGIKDAKQADKRANEAEAAYGDVLEKAKQDARDIVASAKQEKDSIVAEAQKGAEVIAARMVEEVEARIERDIQNMKNEFRGYAAELSVHTAEKIIADAIDVEKAQEIARNHTEA